MPARRKQTSLTFQVHCPLKWIGHTFGELVKSWLLEQDALLKDVGPVIAIALYRTHGSGEDRQCCMVCAPTKDTILAASDLVTVLAPVAFGKVMHDHGLICGAEKAERQVTP